MHVLQAMSDLSERLPVPRSVTDLMILRVLTTVRMLTTLSAELGRRTLGKQSDE